MAQTQKQVELRPYQVDFKKAIYHEVSQGKKRIICQLAQGGGKTTVFTAITQDILSKGRKVLVVVQRRKLIFQASQTFVKNKIPHGVIMANHPRRRPKCPIQIASIDTLRSREEYSMVNDPDAVLIVDECHDAAPSNKAYARLMKEFNGVILGFTATPYGDNTLWDSIVNTIRPDELRNMGYLVPTITKVPDYIDISGNIDDQKIEEIVNTPRVTGNVIEHWKKWGKGRQTIIFAVTVKHSKALEEAFCEAGIKIRHCDADTPEKKREQYIRQMNAGKIDGLTNVGLFGTGVDIPPVSCLMIVRPSKSLIWWLQALGRGIRIHPESSKENCIVIDAVGNTLRPDFGDAYTIREASLDKDTQSIVKSRGRRCSECGHFWEGGSICPDCGCNNSKLTPVNPKPLPKERKGDLTDWKPTPAQLAEQQKKALISDYHKLRKVAEWRKMNPRWVYHKLKAKHEMRIILRHRREIKLPLDMNIDSEKVKLVEKNGRLVPEGFKK